MGEQDKPPAKGYIIDAIEPDLSEPPTPLTNYRTTHYGSEAALVVDMGSQNTRVGWSTDTEPILNFETIVSKYRERVPKGSHGGKSQLNVGPVLHSTLIGKSNMRSPFDINCINSIEHAESILDFSFLNLGIDTESIQHPILVTEPAGNPLYSRNLMTELLFECYQVPKLTYGIDGLLSYYENNGGKMDTSGLVVSAGHHTTHLIPVFDLKGQMAHSTRISYGGFTAADFMLKLMQMKYPSFPTKMTFGQAQNLVDNYTFFASDYPKALKRLGQDSDLEYFSKLDITVQFPYNEPTAEEKSQEELDRIALRRKAQGERLRDQVIKQRKERVIQKEKELESLVELRAAKKVSSKSSFLRMLQDFDIEDEVELEAQIIKVEKTLKRAQEKELGIEASEEKVVPVFDLIDIPDSELSEDSCREKRKQRLLKAGYDARERMRLAKLEEEEAKAEEAKKDEEFKERDFEGWLKAVRAKHDDLDLKVKARNKLKSQLQDRRSQASQLRMKSIAQLAREEKPLLPTKRARRKGDDGDDNFGENDHDWNVYRQISKDEDSEDEDYPAQLAQLEAVLLENDPTFQTELDSKSSLLKFNPTQSFLHRYQFGLHFSNWEEMDDIKAHHQLHCNIERLRVPEALFQPSMIGLDQAGPAEGLAAMFKRVGVNWHKEIVKNIHLTGGFSQIPKLSTRLDKLVTSLSPSHFKVKINPAKRPQVDAWRGAARYIRNGLMEKEKAYLSKEQYLELGHDYVLDHGVGNWH